MPAPAHTRCSRPATPNASSPPTSTRAALELTRRNAALNELANIATRAGSFLEPVDGERYDLVIANPPYVISPDHDFLYRDARLLDDGVRRTCWRSCPLLQDGGYGCLQGNWIQRRDEPWYRPLGRCLRGAGCDALLIRYATWNPLAYATAWCAPHHTDDLDKLREAVNRWRASFAAAGIEAICGALVLLRRRPGTAPLAPRPLARRPPSGARRALPGNHRRERPPRTWQRSAQRPPVRSARPRHRTRPASGRARAHNAQMPPARSSRAARRLGVLADVVLRLDGTCTPGDLLDDRSLASRIADLLKLGLLDYCGEDEALTSR